MLSVAIICFIINKKQKLFFPKKEEKRKKKKRICKFNSNVAAVVKVF